MNPDTLLFAKTYFIRGWSFESLVRHLEFDLEEREAAATHLCELYGPEVVFPPEPAGTLAYASARAAC